MATTHHIQLRRALPAHWIPARPILARWIFVGVLLGMVSAGSSVAAGRETGFLNRTVKLNGQTYRYQVYVPSEWNKRKKWPVILFLHGAGERGEDGRVQTEVGMGAAIRRHPDRFPCIVVMPQCRCGIWWANPEMEAQALKALELSLKEFKGDANRVYLTGLSMGGYGTWSMAARNPGRFAALVPICGGVRPPRRVRSSQAASLANNAADPYADTAEKVGETPVWIFHGGADRTVPVSESRKMNTALKDAGRNVTYTEYPGVGHNSWDKAYGEDKLLPWILEKRLR